MNLSRKTLALLFILILIILTVSSLLLRRQPEHDFAFSSYQELERLFSQRGYDSREWEQGLTQIPPLYLTRIPQHWTEEGAAQLSIREKKLLFFRWLTPLVLRSNLEIMAEQARLAREGGKDTAWLQAVAEKYKVPLPSRQGRDGELLAALKLRLAPIPPSLALAQAAEESGWGSSRFAVQGNALYGQWTWSGTGMDSKERQQGKGKYQVASFASPADSVAAYMLNLNTHPSYQEFRSQRAALVDSGRPAGGIQLAQTLSRYSQRGQAYVEDLRLLITKNHLQRLDQARLSPDPPLYLVPLQP
ncbi:glucosaminidase domain-containing protein [Desulfogranum mediterraneum]|uniref:glucosaminidase domain-containing protein n=1 Tax=Desulfogranum mediterraneum TaxID=160661 RepID=UPI000408259A|nr:glucosaminidase domain-containing protein [Desulfogranum mediterraneum]